MDPASAFSFDLSYCGSPPVPAEIWSRWNVDPLLLVGLAVIAIAGLPALRRVGWRRQLSFAAAWLLAAILFVSPICALTVALFSARVGHHVALSMVLAPMLALALSPRRARRLGLLPALAVSTLALWLWHAPDLYTASFAHPAIYWAMQVSLLGSFTWLWAGLLRAGSPLAAGAAALASAVQMSLLGALLVFAPEPLYLPHLGSTLSFGFSPIDDQQLAGLIMWVPANLPLLALILWRSMAVLGPHREPAA